MNTNDILVYLSQILRQNDPAHSFNHIISPNSVIIVFVTCTSFEHIVSTMI